MEDAEFYKTLISGSSGAAMLRMYNEVARRYIQAVEPRLTEIHNRLTFLDESDKTKEIEEQILSVRYIRPDACVLELGSNVGRNTLVIASILDDPGSQLVTVECDPVAYKAMRKNLRRNHLNARTVCAAISTRPLFRKGYDTSTKRWDLSWDKVDVVSFEALQSTCEITFDTLVADCEGALEQILRDNPGMLKGFRLLILENDYHTVEAYKFVNGVIRASGFKRVLSWPCLPPTNLPIKHRFYAVWQKTRADEKP